MDKDALLKQALKEYDDDSKGQMTFGTTDEQTAYKLGVKFGRDYLENWLRKCFKFLP